MKCGQCKYDKLPDSERPRCCNVIHERRIEMSCEYFTKIR